MAVNSFVSNQGTQTALLTDNTGGASGTLIPVYKLSMDAQGTYTDANVFQGTLKAVNTIGTLPNLPGGSIVMTLGTISTMPNIPGGTMGLVTRVGNVGTLEVGTISSLPNIPGGTIGSVLGVGVIPNVPGGTLGSILGIGSVSGLSNLPQGSINVTAGTVGGKAASGVAISGNPIPVGGTDGGGTVYTFLTDIKGQQYLGGGTVSMLNAGTISTLPNIPGGTITRVSTIGTLEVGTISSLPNLPQGSINVTAGTVGGKAASGAAISGNPLPVGGTDGGGTVYAFLTDTKGQQYLGGGTVSMLNAGTLTTIPNIPGGTIGSILGVAVVTTVTNLSNGTIQSSGTTTGVGTISNIGSLGMLNAGTISSLPNLPQGSINVTAGTIGAGTFVMTAGTITAGTFGEAQGALGTMTITLASLASSTVGVGRQSTLIDNTSNLYNRAKIYARVTTGGTPTLNSFIYFYLVMRDNVGVGDDAVGASDAAGTVINSELLGAILVNGTASNTAFSKSFDTGKIAPSLGPQWGIMVVNSIGNALNSTAGSHLVTWAGIKSKFA